MIKGTYIIRKFKNNDYYLDLMNPINISNKQPNQYGILENKIYDNNRKINYFTIHITNECNMHCKYCFEKIKSNNHINLETIDSLVNFIENNENVGDNINIRFFGGEPLLKIDLIEFIINKIKIKVRNKKIKFNIFTNGTIMNEKLIKLITKYNIVLFISLDGNKYTQDLNRNFKGQNSSHKLIVDNISMLIKLFPNNIIIRTVVTPDTFFYLIENLEFINNLGIYKNSFTLSWGDKFLDNNVDYKIIIDEIFNKIFFSIVNHKFNWIGLHPISKMLFNILNNIPLLELHSCGVGCEHIAISVDGDIYPCHAFVNNKNFIIGNLNSKKIDLNNKLAIKDSRNILGCCNCDLKFSCQSRCLADNLMMNNDVDICCTKKCDIEKYFFDSICNLAIKLQKFPKEKRLLNMIYKKNKLWEYA